MIRRLVGLVAVLIGLGVHLAPAQCAVSPLNTYYGLPYAERPTGGAVIDGTVSLSNLAVNVRDCSAKGDGVTDDTRAIQAAINAVQLTNGGTVFFPTGTYLISSTLLVTKSSVRLAGDGSWYTANIGTNLATGTILRTTTAGLTMLRLAPIQGASAQALKAEVVTGLAFDGSATAAIGLEALSVNGSRFVHLYFQNFTTAAINLGVVTTLGENRGTTRNVFESIGIRQLDGSGASGIGIQLDGDQSATPTANTSNNNFHEIQIDHKNGNGITLLNADNNRFYGVNTNLAAGGSGKGVEFVGSTLADGVTARNNIFYWYSAGSGSVQADANTFSSHDNEIFVYDVSNGAAQPTVQAGAGLSWINNQGYDLSYSRQSADRGDASVTLIAGADAPIQIFNTVLTANRTCTVNTTGINAVALPIGAHFRIVRTATATGGFSLTCFGVAVAAGQWVDGMYNGVSWVASGAGPISPALLPVVSVVATTTPALNASAGSSFLYTITSNIAAVVAVPTGAPSGSFSQVIFTTFRNSSGGALTTPPTFNTGAGGFKFSAGTIVNPTNGTQVTYEWIWDPVQGFWYETDTPVVAPL